LKTTSAEVGIMGLSERVSPCHRLRRGAGTRAAAGLVLLAALAGLGACSRGPSEAQLLASARTLQDKGDLKGAVIQLKSALQKDPKSAEARFLLGKSLLASGDPVAALVELSKAQELQIPSEQVVPEIARAMLLVGDEAKLITQYAELQLHDDSAAADLKTSLATAYAVQRDPQRAEQALEDALHSQPGYAPALVVQARLAVVRGDVDGSLALLNQVLARDPGDTHAGQLKADILLRARNDPAAALAALRQVLAGHPDALAARSEVIDILLLQNQLAPARAEFEVMRKAAPQLPQTVYYQARFAFADKDYQAVRELTQRVLKVAPDNVRVLELAGAAAFRIHDDAQAEQLLGHVLQSAPGRLLSRQLLAQIDLRRGQSEKALEVLGPVIDSAHPDGASLALAGEAYLALGDTRRSDEAYQRAIQAAPADAQIRTSAAVAEMVRGHSDAAISDLEAVASADSSPRANLALISARLRQNDFGHALQEIVALEKKMPDQPLPPYLRGRVQTLQHDLPNARQSFQAALAKDPNYFPAIASLSAIDLGAGQVDAARKRLDDALRAQPKSTQVRLALAELQARTGAPAAEVTATLRDAVRVDPSQALPQLMLIKNLLARNDSKAALQAAQDASAAVPNNLQVMDALGQAQLAAGAGQRAVSTYTRLTELQPRNPLHALHLADAYLLDQENAAAAGALRQALEIQPDLAPAKRGLAQIALRDKRPQDALVIARDWQKQGPKDPGGFLLEGDIQSAGQHWDAATSAYRAALQRTPAATEVAMKLHGALLAGAKQAEADQFAVGWLKSQPKDLAFRYYLGDMALARNQFAQAEQHYRSVLELQPANALALNNVAWLMVKQGEPGAVALAEQASKLMPDQAQLLDTLAAAQAAAQQLPQAIETQKRAVALDPKDRTLSLRLARLYIAQGDKPRARAELEVLARLGDSFPAQAEVASLLKTL
jgi:putative PEP-CTERM system TPR-repeat lipoprotein